MKVRYTSNGGHVADATRITKVWTDNDGVQHMSIMVDEKTGRHSEIDVVASDVSEPMPDPDPAPIPEPEPDPIPDPDPVPNPYPTPVPPPQTGTVGRRLLPDVPATAQSLAEVKSQLKAGQNVAVAAGVNLGQLTLNASDVPNPGVLVRSAQMGHPAVITGMKLSGVDGLHVQGLEMATDPAGKKEHHEFGNIDNCRNLTITDMNIHGDGLYNFMDVDAVPYTTLEAANAKQGGFGLHLRGCHDVKLLHNEISNMWKGIMVNGSQRVEVAHNHLHNQRSDGINFTIVTDYHQHDNLIEFFRGADNGDHHDFTAGFNHNGASSNILIEDETYDTDFGCIAHPIWIVSTVAGNPWQNIKIRRVRATTAHVNGIGIFNCTGGEVVDCVLTAIPANKKYPYNSSAKGIGTPRFVVPPSMAQSGNQVI